MRCTEMSEPEQVVTRQSLLSTLLPIGPRLAIIWPPTLGA